MPKPALQFVRGLCGLLLVFTAAAAGAPIEVSVSIPPQKYLVDRIGGSRVQTSVLLAPGRSPAAYEPTARQLADLGRARLYFRIGVPFEDVLLPRIIRMWPELPIVDTAGGLRQRRMEGGHQSGIAKTGEQGRDPHTWLSPRLLKVQSRVICEALIRVDPESEAAYARGLELLIEDLDALDVRLKKLLDPLRGRSFLVFHPSWGYFADAYGLRQEAIETEGKAPNPRGLARLVDRARREKISTIFIQPQFDREAARALAEEIGGEVIPLDSLAEDCIKNLEESAEKIRRALIR